VEAMMMSKPYRRAMTSPQLKALRHTPTWPPARAHFRNLIAQHGKPVVHARVHSFLKCYAADPASAVVDAVLSVRWDWTNRVAPAVHTWKGSNPNRSLAVLATAGPGAKVGINTLRSDHVAAIMGVAQAILQFGNPR
jgi:hypothetical protein